MPSLQKPIYYQDQYIKEVSTKVLEIHGDKILLTDVIAIPPSNTEPGDKASINGVSVASLSKDKEKNLIWYQIESGDLKVGQQVNLSIDWEWRLNVMKLHTILHLIAGVYESVNADDNRPIAGTVKETYCELVFKEAVSNDKILEVVDKANRDIESGLEVKHRWDAAREGFRWTQVGNYEPIPDGGLHVKNIKEIGEIYYLGSFTKEGKTKIRFSYLPDGNNKTQENQKHIEDRGEKHSIRSDAGDLSNFELTRQFDAELENASANGSFDDLYLKYLSKTHGLLTQEIKALGKLLIEEKKELGPKLNALKTYIEESIEKARQDYTNAQITDSDIDLTIPYPPVKTGYLHPTTQVVRQMNEFFKYYGFSIGEGPEIETAEYNFRRLNLPEGHPATDLQDTLFVKEPDILLRTHTSSIEARILESYKPPIRVVIPGKVFRNETLNATNGSFFHHYQGVVVDKGITIQNLKWIMEKFHQYLFEDDNIELRFRYKYYPEVSPGMGVDVKCRFCNGSGCAVCKQRGWVEVLGCGMIHYNTLKMSGIDPEIYTGFAWGMGLDRLVMAKFGISDIRKLYGGLAYA